MSHRGHRLCASRTHHIWPVVRSWVFPVVSRGSLFVETFCRPRCILANLVEESHSLSSPSVTFTVYIHLSPVASFFPRRSQGSRCHKGARVSLHCVFSPVLGKDLALTPLHLAKTPLASVALAPADCRCRASARDSSGLLPHLPRSAPFSRAGESTRFLSVVPSRGLLCDRKDASSEMAGAVAKKNLFSVLTEEEEVMKKLDRQERRRQRKQEREQARAAAEAERAQQLAATPASARVGSGRWADFSEDDEDYDFMQPGVAVNGDRKPRSGKDTEDAFYTTESESETDSEEEEEQEAEASSSSDSEDETNVQRRPEPATPTRNKPGHEGDAAPHAAKLLSRKERKQRELAELDALFNEMHIAPSPGSEKEPQAASRGGNDGVARRQANGVGRAEEETQGGGASEAAKKKKKKKKPTGSAGATSPQAGEGATQANNSDDEKEDSPKSEDCPRRPGTVKPPGVPAGMRRKAGAGAGRGSTADEARRLAALEEEKKKAAAKKEKKAKLYFPKNQ
ncbi:hypothetical protein TGGT1_289290 [Toxoplasma gondii GT1]|uniref:Uncharacterized protein n=8 Tax=Toxoplasma gondii TaxID=5811 RepID=S7W4V7_TOXGG|nr:hypothetical protein TGGT1_289290 [Toxoplasma gondii GT1]